MFRKFSYLLLFLCILLSVLLTCNGNLTLGIDDKMELDDTVPPYFADDSDKTIIITPRSTAVGIVWAEAADNLSEQNELEYKIVYSETDNIDTAENAINNGITAFDWAADTYSGDVTGLTVDTTYYFNVLVRDKAGLTVSYTMGVSTTLEDSIAPYFTSATLLVNDTNMEDATLEWTKAEDIISPQYALEYRLYYLEGESADKNEIYSSGTAFDDDWSADIKSIRVTELTDAHTYSFTVAVRDENNNVALYDTVQTTTEKHGRIFWTDISNDEIRVADLDGSNDADVLSGLNDPMGISVDPVDRRIYWINFGDSPQTIKSCNFDGNDVQTHINTGMTNSGYLAVDASARHLFWTDKGANCIYRSSLPPDNPDAATHILIDDDLGDNIDSPEGIDIDSDDNRIFWTENAGGSGVLKSAFTDGTLVIEVFTISGETYDLAAHDNDNSLYWVENYSPSMLRKCNYSGTTSENIITSSMPTPYSIAVDIENDLLVWIANNRLHVCSLTPPTSDADDYDFTSEYGTPAVVDIY
ncbi:MAG: hypothetical protein PQJ61_10310 [Spirochaetales bacterium]|uniref:Fibronectin type-III domain-containing protein n=1 Tax=Candidatus Thalassospirochaeta sargassi TaxID=3119039 RepID=A0AAJ1IFN0_9SPIO|nr:hypothetical protein [Spirochaetales bacterium]